jgi:hypothetical protein
MKQLPNSFLTLTHEGVHRVTIQTESVFNIDALIAKFALEKQLVFPRIAESPFGQLHLAVRTTNPPWKMAILELSAGSMVFDTLYHPVKRESEDYEDHPEFKPEEWVSPCFIKFKDSFPLRCEFQFKLWHEAGIKLFLSVSSQNLVQFWAYFEGQIYRPPFGNIFESTYQICMGHNETQITKAFDPRIPDSVKLSHIINILSGSPWNADTFLEKDVSVLNDLVRFDSTREELPMLSPLKPERIKECQVAANKDLAEITAKIVTFVMTPEHL